MVWLGRWKLACVSDLVRMNRSNLRRVNGDHRQRSPGEADKLDDPNAEAACSGRWSNKVADDDEFPAVHCVDLLAHGARPSQFDKWIGK
jgi:hypothetical protein